MKKAKSCYINKEVFNQYSAEEHLKSIGYANKAIMTILVDAASNVITKYDLEKNLNLLKDLYQKREFERILTDNIKDSHNIEVGIEKTLQDLFELRNAIDNNQRKNKKTWQMFHLNTLTLLAIKMMATGAILVIH